MELMAGRRLVERSTTSRPMVITPQPAGTPLLPINKGIGGLGDLRTGPLKKPRPDFCKETAPKELLLSHHLSLLAETSRS